jgi:hypothetical protein
MRARSTYDELLGENGRFARDLEGRTAHPKKEDFGMSLIAAITEKAVVSF